VTSHSNHTKAKSCELISLGVKLDLKFQNFRKKYDFFFRSLEYVYVIKNGPK